MQSPEGEKYKHALQWKVQVVTIQWMRDSVAAKGENHAGWLSSAFWA